MGFELQVVSCESFHRSLLVAHHSLLIAQRLPLHFAICKGKKGQCKEREAESSL